MLRICPPGGLQTCHGFVTRKTWWV